MWRLGGIWKLFHYIMVVLVVVELFEVLLWRGWEKRVSSKAVLIPC